jgi:secretion/DNA translocation related TadE-like protein
VHSDRAEPTPQRGAVSIVMACGALVLAVLSLGVADLGAMVAARAKAQAAADAAALAAAAQLAPVLGQGHEPESAARAEAEANGATLVSCSCAPGDASATVEVELVPRIAFVSGWRERRVRARARAEIDPNVLTYRTPG